MLIYLQALDSAGDRARFESLYTAYRGLMYHVAYGIVKNEQDAEDAVHTAFLSLAEHSLPPELGPRARCLAVTVAERKAIDLYRSKQRHPVSELEENIPGCEGPPSDGTLAGAMAALPPRYREVLLLRYYNGYTAAEIAGFLGLTPENVRQITARAKRHLAAELAERGEVI